MMRIGMIGTGWVTGIHAQAFSQVEGVELVGIAGRNPQRRELLARQWGAQPFADYRELLAQGRLDGVVIALPPHLHGEVEVACAASVRGVLVEKPLAQAWEPTETARKAFEAAGTLVAVGYQNRYRLGFQKAREWFAQAEDKPVLVNGWWVGDRPSPGWWKRKEESGGQFVEQCTHLVDLARALTGEIVEVQAMGTTAFRTDLSATVEDAVTVNTRFASGAIGNFTTGCFAAAGSTAMPGIGLVVASRSATVRFSGWGMECRITGPGVDQRYESEPDIFTLQAQVFVEALRTGNAGAIASSYEDGQNSLRVGLAANESLATGRPVVF